LLVVDFQFVMILWFFDYFIKNVLLLKLQ